MRFTSPFNFNESFDAVYKIVLTRECISNADISFYRLFDLCIKCIVSIVGVMIYNINRIK